MAKISLTKYFPPTTTSVLEINEILRDSNKLQFRLSFKTNLGSSQSYVGNGVTYNATLKVSGTGIETQTKTARTLQNTKKMRESFIERLSDEEKALQNKIDEINAQYDEINKQIDNIRAIK